MSVLSDKDIVERLVDRQLVPGLETPANGDWYSKESPVQPASLDLHVGDIFLPEAKPGERGSESLPLKQHVLAAGETILIRTKEELRMPDDLAAIGFPPAGLSVSGILMTNPGHVDPGYKGPMHVTVINMGTELHPFAAGERIFTVCFFQLSSPAKQGYVSRGEAGGFHTQDNLGKLSRDFADMERRAQKIVNGAAGRVAITAALITVIGTVWLGAANGYFGKGWKDSVSELTSRLSKVESAVETNKEYDELDRQISQIREEIRQMQRKPNNP